MKSELTHHLVRALQAALALSAQLQDSDRPASVSLLVHANNLERILTDLETL